MKYDPCDIHSHCFGRALTLDVIGQFDRHVGEVFRVGQPPSLAGPVVEEVPVAWVTVLTFVSRRSGRTWGAWEAKHPPPQTTITWRHTRETKHPSVGLETLGSGLSSSIEVLVQRWMVFSISKMVSNIFIEAIGHVSMMAPYSIDTITELTHSSMFIFFCKCDCQSTRW